MTSSPQDQFYVDVEADAFFDRNQGSIDARALRAKKRTIVDQLDAAGLTPRRVLELGCNYGDLLHLYAQKDAECHGVEPSRKALDFGRSSFDSGVALHHGTIAENPVSADPKYDRYFDLVVVDDVLCWVSRETLFHSIRNIDNAIGEGGFLFLREFFPLKNTRNRNHHVQGEEIYCYKPAGPHVAMFLASGMYAIVSQRVTLDDQDAWAEGKPFESRWSDTLLRKSLHEYYD